MEQSIRILVETGQQTVIGSHNNGDMIVHRADSAVVVQSRIKRRLCDLCQWKCPQNSFGEVEQSMMEEL